MRKEEKDEIARQVEDNVTKKIIYTVVAVVVILLLLKMCGAIIIGVGNTISKEVKRMKSSEELVEKAAIHISEENYEKGIEYLDKAIKLDPNNPVAYLFRGGTLTNLGKYEQALLDADKLIELEPNDCQSHSLKGYIFANMSQWENSIPAYNIAIELCPYDSLLYFNRGCSYYYMKEYNNALSDFNSVIVIDPNFRCDVPDSNCIYYWRGLAFEGLDKKEEAAVDFKKACNFGIVEACKMLKTNQ